MSETLSISISPDLLHEIHTHGEASYPEEGAGLILGVLEQGMKKAIKLLTFENARELSARHNRYLLTPQDFLHGEQQAARLGLDVIGVFHSHPDHPNQPSEFDRDWAMPRFSYIITSVESGKAAGSRSWSLSEDRSRFDEERLLISEPFDFIE